MEDLEFYFLVPNLEKKQDLVGFSFSERESDEPAEECTLQNEGYVEESVAISGLSELSKVPRDKIASLLRGEIDIAEIPEFDHTSVLHERARVKVGDCYYYRLQNGVFIFGLDSSHEVFQSIQRGGSTQGLKVDYDPGLTSNIWTQSRGKRRRNREFNLSKVCEITTQGKTYSVHIPEELSNYEVIEINSRLNREPDLLSSKEGWLAILLDKDKTILKGKDLKTRKHSSKKHGNK